MKKEYDGLASKVGGYQTVLNGLIEAGKKETVRTKIAANTRAQKKARADVDIATTRMTELKTRYMQMVDDKKTRDQE